MTDMLIRFTFVALLILGAHTASAQAGPVTSAEAEAIALKAEPGTVENVDRKRMTGGNIYEFIIEKSNGTIMEVEVDGRSGEIVTRKIRKLGEDVPLPRPKISQKKAGQIAHDHIRDLTPGKRRISIENVRYFLRRGQLLYEIHVRKYYNKYVLEIDAMTGEILSVDKKL